MAIENVQMAAAAYQGSKPAAAAPKAEKAEKSVRIVPEAVPVEAVSVKTSESRPVSVMPADTGAEVEREKTAAEDSASVRKDNKRLQEAVEKLKKNMNNNTEAIFGIHEGTNRIMIKIVDKDTKDVIKEFPPEETLDMIQKVWEMAGILVDEKL